MLKRLKRRFLSGNTPLAPQANYGTAGSLVSESAFPPELSLASKTLIRRVIEQQLSMTPLQSLICTAQAVEYVIGNNISGAFVEWVFGEGAMA